MSRDRGKLEPLAPPYVDCIQWVPRRFAGGPSPVTVGDLVFTQAALKAVRDVVGTRSETSVFGLLLGEVRQDPTCARPWARVSAAFPGPSLSGDPSASSLSTVLDGMLSDLGDSTLSIVGWYRSHPGAGLYLAEGEAEFHATRFPDPWGFALIMVGGVGRLTGSVFQRTDPEGLSRSVYTPFYELVHPSSEFNGTTKRTFAGWPNYQTETRVVEAGHGSVSSEISGSEEALIEATPRPSEPAEEAPSPDGSTDVDEEWEKKQIHRSLTAVGRSLSGASLGDLDTPVTVDRAPSVESPSVEPLRVESPRVESASVESAGVESRSTESAGVESRVVESADASRGTRSEPEPQNRDLAEMKVSSPEDEDRTIIPIHPSVIRPTEPDRGLVGRGRRNNRIPVATIGSAVGALALLGAAGWFGARMMGDKGAALDGSDSTPASSAVASIGLAPTGLFPGNDGADLPEAMAEGDDEIGRDRNGEITTGQPDSDRTSLEGTTAVPIAYADFLETRDILAAAAREARSADLDEDPVTPPLAPQVVDAPALEGIQIGDPEESAFQNALGIFHQEGARYEELRAAFDDGTETCNPLNLSFRGVRDSFERLSRRFSLVAEHLDGSEVRDFEAARRQNAMIEAHYGLTDCPVSPGGF